MKTDPNEKVNPGAWHPEMGWSPSEHVAIGLTKREWLAGLAMQGHFDPQGCEDRIAKLCVKMADALIVELNKEQK